MIFVTVGSQEPFDRLIRTVDEWARVRARSDVFAQIGNSSFHPQHIRFTQFIEPSDFNRVIHEAHIVVAHAGVGSILSALELGKQIVVMPRRANLRETRNDHQVATAERFALQGRVIMATDERDLFSKLDYAITLGSALPITDQASGRLLGTIRAFLVGQHIEPSFATGPTYCDSGGDLQFPS